MLDEATSNGNRITYSSCPAPLIRKVSSLPLLNSEVGYASITICINAEAVGEYIIWLKTVGEFLICC